ncbi:MAG: hypothetical protein CMM47_07310 [Rhodospirillaceae bacterium]|nr:hypothetical protein [Rhodospirillaceae bacterium]
MLVLFTDFGHTGPYVGQIKGVLHRLAPNVPVIDLLHDAPAFDPKHSAYLLAAYATEFPAETVFVTVVDPGVGSKRRPVVLYAQARWYVGPDNGLLHGVSSRSSDAQAWEITWRPHRLTDSFHGRDLFTPIAAGIASGTLNGSTISKHVLTPMDPSEIRRPSWPDDLPEVVYIDPYGNAITGMRATKVDRRAAINVSGAVLHFARTFSDVAQGIAFWHENSSGLVEIAINQKNAAHWLDLKPGTKFSIVQSGVMHEEQDNASFHGTH